MKKYNRNAERRFAQAEILREEQYRPSPTRRQQVLAAIRQVARLPVQGLTYGVDSTPYWTLDLEEVRDTIPEWLLPLCDKTDYLEGLSCSPFEVRLEAAMAIGRAWKEYRHRRRAKSIARRIGLDFWPAVMLEPEVDPMAFKYAEDHLYDLREKGVLAFAAEENDNGTPRGVVLVPASKDHWGSEVPAVRSRGGWDAQGHYGLSPGSVRKLWYIAGCRNTLKFRWLVRTAYKLSGHPSSGHLHLKVSKKDGLEKTIRICKALEWLARVLPSTDFTNVRPGTLQMLGRLKGFSRAAALFERNVTTVTPEDLNWDMVRKVRTMSRDKKAELFLSPATQWRYLFKLEVSKEAADLLPPPGGLKLKCLRALATSLGGENSLQGVMAQDDIAVPLVNLTILFGSIGAIEQYGKKVGKFVANPDTGRRTYLHDLGQFRLPKSRSWDRQAWARLALKFGKEVTEYGALFADIEAKLGGVPSSLKALRESAGSFLYEGVGEGEEELAQLCHVYKMPQSGFEDYQKVFRLRKKAEALPYVRVEGKDIPGLEGDWVFEKLDATDPSSLFLGLATDCCQHLEGAARSCVIHGWSSVYGGFYAVRYNGRVVAQSWAWRARCGGLVFDNIEFLGGSYQEASLALYDEAAVRLLGRLGVNRVHVGLDYAEPYTGRWSKSDKLLRQVGAGCQYSDAGVRQACIASLPKEQRKALKKNGIKFQEGDLDVDAEAEAGPSNTLMPDSGILCEYCEAEVHPTAEICPTCQQDISEWV